MTNYPTSQDNTITLPPVSGITDEDLAITALREAVFAIEVELGLVPSGVYSDTRARLDILEARVNFGVSPSIPNDGYVKSPLYIWNVPSNVILSISDGYGVPTENRLSGSLFMRADGYANNDFYIRRGSSWSPIQTDPFVASGDLMGNYLSQTVIGLYNKPLNSTMATVGATQDGYHLTWNNSLGKWEPQTGFIALGDLTIDSSFYGRIGQKVIRFQNRNFAATTPVGTVATDGSSIKWNTLQNQWEPQSVPVIWVGSVNANDGYTTKTNISSNRTLQAPNNVTGSKIGMVNFGSRSSGLAVGTTDSYAAILSGDRGAASGNFSLIVGGDNHQALGQYSTVVNGLLNIASGQYSFVSNGTGGTGFGASGQYSFVSNGNNNLAAGIQSFILDGYTNAAHNSNSFVLNGGNNTADGYFSGILNGISNIITAGATHSGIGWGTSNTIAAAATNSIILSGATNVANSPWSLIGNGNNITVTGLYATVLNATIANVNGLHSLVLNGNTNNITGTFSTIGNGNNNTISGNPAYATILDGYSNTISSNGGLILDGYSNTVSGIWSTVINGNFNSIGGRNSTILNGASNTMDANSTENTILVGTLNSHINSNNTVVIGSGNTLTNVNSHFVLGGSNNHQSTFSFTNGSLNTSTAGASFNRIWGSSNTLNASTITGIFGNSNTLGATTFTTGNFIAGSSNALDGGGNSIVLGSNNIVSARLANVKGQFGRASLFGQEVSSNAKFNSTGFGEAQWSRLVLDGYSTVGGTAFLCQLQDTNLASPTNPSFRDGYSYDMQIRVMVVNISPINPNPVVPARFVFDVLAHQEGGVLILDSINETLITRNISDDPAGATRSAGWNVTLSAATNQLAISVDAETSPANYVQPSNTPSNRRAVATIEMREMSRL